MIRKLYTAVIVILVLMFGLKLLLSLRSASETTAAADISVLNAGSRSDLELTCYYTTQPSYESKNSISGRNGFLLDQLKAIFPKMRLVCCDQKNENDSVFWNSFTNDPCGVVCSIKSIPYFEKFPMSKSSLGRFVLRVFTLRKSNWRYSGTNSLSQVELLVPEWISYDPFVKDLQSRGKVRFIDEKVDRFVALTEPGPEKAFLEPGSTDPNECVNFELSYNHERGRRSEPIYEIPIYLRVNDRDPDMAKRILEDFEAGMKRIIESGERRRICEYYGFDE